MTEGFFISVAGQELPSWCGLENKWKRPPRCCSTRWARDAMIIYSPGVGSAFEKCWCWEKMALLCLKGKPQGGQMLWYSSRGIAAGPHGCSLPSRGKFCWVTPTQLSRRSRGNGRQWAAACSSGHAAAFTNEGKREDLITDCTNLQSVRESVSCSMLCCCINKTLKSKTFWAFDPYKTSRLSAS